MDALVNISSDVFAAGYKDNMSRSRRQHSFRLSKTNVAVCHTHHWQLSIIACPSVSSEEQAVLIALSTVPSGNNSFFARER